MTEVVEASSVQPHPADVLVALVGRQNSGKTSLLMHLTRTLQRPVNFPGSSVERTECSVEVGGTRLRLVDLPGIGSLVPVSRDEEVALDYLRGAEGRSPDVLCLVADAGKLSVELHLFGELADLGVPVVVALNKNDVARAEGREVDGELLERILAVPVVETNGLTGANVEELERALVAAAGAVPPRKPREDSDAIAARVTRNRPTPESRTERLDRIFLHRLWGLPILGVVVLGIFELVYSGAEPFVSGIESAQEWLSGRVESLLEPGALRSFLVDGLINGVGSVLVFLPQIALLIALISILEASGYMARAAFLLDRVLGRFGLSGRSFVPLTSSFACAIPGILATRIIDNERDRLATIAVAPLMSCSARLPVYVLFIGAFFSPAAAPFVLAGLYGMGIVLAAVVALVLRRSVLRGGHSALMMELPAYERPSPRVVLGQVVSACREFLVLAGTVIFATSVVIWAASYYPRPAAIHASFEAQRRQAMELPEPAREQVLARLGTEEEASYLEQSFLARGGKALQPLFAPAGFDWRTTVGILAAFPARELIVPSLGILYRAGEVDPGAYDLAALDGREDGGSLRERLRSARRDDGSPVFSRVVALALMVFFALCSQCVSTLATIRRETRSWRWPAFTFVYMTTLAWVGAVAVYQIGSALDRWIGS